MTKREFETAPRVGIIKSYWRQARFTPAKHALSEPWTYAVDIATWGMPWEKCKPKPTTESSTPIPAKLDRDIILQAIREIADEMERRPINLDIASHGIAAIQALTKFCDNTRS